MDVYSILKKDHESIRRMFSEFMDKKEQAGGDLFYQIKNKLTAHMKAEESFFYPVLEQDESTREPTLESIEEHHVTKLLLGELEGMSPKDDHWVPKMKVLREVTEHHLEEEEESLFTEAHKAMSDQQAQDIGRKVSDILR